MSGTDPAPAPQTATVRRRRFSPIWAIPVVAGGVAIYLAVSNLADRGPMITIAFRTANGITAQQTLVTHKAVTLGTVEDVKLSDDLSQALVNVRMNRQGKQLLTENSRFWVVRPRLTPGSISGLETLVSGAYIEVDPGAPGGEPKRRFTGLEEPPAIRSDEPGKLFVLQASRLGSIGPGAPIFYRDVSVGEVLGYDLGDGLGPVTINAFVKSPYDKFVHDRTLFWNASGVSLNVGPQGLHLELQSLQAVLSGGITFETPRATATDPASPANRVFPLYDSQAEADAAGFHEKLPMVTYFETSVGGLVRGSAVEIFGIQVGSVDDVRLVVDDTHGKIRARVAFELQPERMLPETDRRGDPNPERTAATLVRQGLRAVLETSNFITGQKAIALEYVPNAPAAEIGHEADALLVPSQGGGLDNITASLSDVAAKLAKVPFDEIGKNLNSALHSIDATVSGPALQDSLRNLSATLADARHLIGKADAGMTPVLQRLPKISQDLQAAIQHADAALGDQGYGGNSDFQRRIARLLDQVNDAARSIRLLTDFLDRHPEALLRGRTGEASGK